jgi:hypothetical protein
MNSRWRFVQIALVLVGVAAEPERAFALNCAADSDCAASATCELTPYVTCAGKDPACPAGSACGEKPTLGAPRADCATYVEGICRFPWELPCRQDSDCGNGFRCKEQISTWCRGGASVTDGGASTSWMECGESRGSYACELVAQPCASDSDCGGGLLCREWTDTSTCPKAPTGVDGGAAVDCHAGKLMVCAPPHYFSAPSEPSEPSEPGKSEASDDGDSEPVPSQVGSAGGSSPPQTSQAPRVPDSDSIAADGERASGEAQGCSHLPAGKSSGTWFAALAAALLYRRRRAA